MQKRYPTPKAFLPKGFLCRIPIRSHSFGLIRSAHMMRYWFALPSTTNLLINDSLLFICDQIYRVSFSRSKSVQKGYPSWKLSILPKDSCAGIAKNKSPDWLKGLDSKPHHQNRFVIAGSFSLMGLFSCLCLSHYLVPYLSLFLGMIRTLRRIGSHSQLFATNWKLENKESLLIPFKSRRQAFYCDRLDSLKLLESGFIHRLHK